MNKEKFKNKFSLDFKKISLLRHDSLTNSPYFRTNTLNNEIKNEDEGGENENKRESRVSKKLSELTTKRVIILVLLLICIIPLFSSDYYFDKSDSFTIWMTILRNMADSSVNNSTLFQTYNLMINIHKEMNSPLIFANVPPFSPSFENGDLNKLRRDEKKIYSETLSNGLNIVGIINTKYTAKQNAAVNIARTIFVCIILTLGGLIFSRDANELVLRPLERIIDKVEKIAKDPISSKKILEESRQYQMEIHQIENAIVKIGILLSLGFGEAGSKIISSNMNSTGDVNPLIPGSKKKAIFGFCDIRNFTDSTEVLQEDVMLFVNTIANVVHKIVDKFGGSANKNIGDAFLIVWKFPEECFITNQKENEEGEGNYEKESEYEENNDKEIQENNNFELNKNRFVKNIVDMSIIAFLKIISSINKKHQVLNYNKNDDLLSRIPNYKVRMGFGLHLGWAIEGAIGSNFKIDASYLSPNVNMASRLEAATKQYGVPILISSKIMFYASKKMNKYCREIDRVTVKGSNNPVGLFTLDIDLEGLLVSKKKDLRKEIKRENHEISKTLLNIALISDEIKANDLFKRDKTLKYITRNTLGTFIEMWRNGFKEYINGNWEKSKEILQSLFDEKKDGPSNTLLNYMGFFNFKAPENWKGYRSLTEK